MKYGFIMNDLVSQFKAIMKTLFIPWVIIKRVDFGE